MGGSGSGGGFSDIEYSALMEKLRASQDTTSSEKFETEISGFISGLQAQYNKRDANAIRAHLDEIKEALCEDIDETLSLLFGGSVAKHTYVDGLSDIDALVVLGKSELKELSPEQVKNYFFRKLKERYPRGKVKQGRLAVTIRFPNAEIQLLPAIKHPTGYHIADLTGKNWSSIKPRRFSRLLTRINEDNGHAVIPTIKLIKSIIYNLPKNRQLTGYHVEALAVHIFKDYTGTKTPKALLTHFF